MRAAADYALVRAVLRDLGGEVYRTRLALGASQHDVASATGLLVQQVEHAERHGVPNRDHERRLLNWLVAATHEHKARRERLRRRPPFSDRPTEETR